MTPVAYEDLDEIYAYITTELHNEMAADNLLEKIEKNIMISFSNLRPAWRGLHFWRKTGMKYWTGVLMYLLILCLTYLPRII